MVAIYNPGLDWFNRFPAKKLARTGLALLLPAGFFWLSVIIYLISSSTNTILLDLFFNNQIIGYILVAGLPLVSGLLSYISYRRHKGFSSQAGMVLSVLLFLMFLVAQFRRS
jgi:hypothetical protein